MVVELLVVALVVLLICSFPVFPYSRGWGYLPTSSIGVLLVLVVVLMLFNVI